MSNEKYTSVPWEWEQVTATQCHVFDTLGEDGLLGPIAIVQNGDIEELAAIARLIAAAPELLEVLKRLLACPDSTTYQQQARAVIAKAIG